MSNTNPTDWTKFASLKVVIIFASIVVLFFCALLVIGLFSSKNIEFLTLKIHGIDTIRITKTDTIYKDRQVIVYKDIPSTAKPNPVMIEQKNKRGDNNASGRDNNGIQGHDNAGNHIVQGPMTGGVNGDVNVTAEKEFTDDMKAPLLKIIEGVKVEKNITSNDFSVIMDNPSNMNKFAGQLRDFLISKGFSQKDEFAISTGHVKKCHVSGDTANNCINIEFGIY